MLKMRETFLLWALCFWCCHLLDAVAQESNSTIFLEASGSVQNGSTGHYDATTAKLALHLQMLVQKFASEMKSQPQGIKYRIELALVDGSKETMDDRQLLECNLAFSKFAGYCKERHIFTPINQQLSHDYMKNLTVEFDHVYSGCYKLKINCCSNRRHNCDVPCANKARMYEQYLGYLETNLQDVNVTRMNISIRLRPIEQGAEVEFAVNYLENPLQILPFQEFDVKIKNRTHHVVEKRVINSNVVNFLNCTETNANCSRSSSLNPDHCVCLPIGNYTVEIHVVDSRCNYPIQNCATHKYPCKRYSNAPVFLDFTKNDESVSMTFTLDTTSIWVPLLALLIIVFLAALLFFKRDWILSKQLYASPEYKDEQLPHIPVRETAQNVRVLLVYDTNDESIQKKASSLRKQMIASGVSIVYDAGDPEQQENVIIRGEIHWFNGYINDSEVRIIVIQSSGMDRCHEELNRDPNAECPVPQKDLEKLSSLIFVLSQLIVLAASMSENELYSRLYLTTYDDVQCSLVRNSLTPYRCYILPEHNCMLIKHMLISQLFDGCRNKT